MANEPRDDVRQAIQDGKAVLGFGTNLEDARQDARNELPEEIDPFDDISSEYHMEIENRGDTGLCIDQYLEEGEDGYLAVLTYEEESQERSSPGASPEGREAYESSGIDPTLPSHLEFE